MRAAAAMLSVLLALAPAGGPLAAIYRCTDQGRVAYRDQPCAATEQQTRIGQGDLAGCYEIEDMPAWEGGAGRWTLRIAADGDTYQLREYFASSDGATRPRDQQSVVMRRARLEETGEIARRFEFKVASGYVLDTPEAKGISGVFNTLDFAGAPQLVGVFPFVNGIAERVSCP
jgi:Domain of unknown function (DUF4124)